MDTLASRDDAGSDGELGRGSALGRYVVLGRLGAGAMGVVYAAFDPELDRKVAIKVLNAREDSKGEIANQRLIREAQSLAKLSNPNVVSVHDVGTHEGSVFVAMEFVEGETLGHWLKRGPERSWTEVLEVFLQAGQGLAAAHRAGLVHRDFKPENVMIDAEGRVCVMDFGLARADEEELPLATKGSVMRARRPLGAGVEGSETLTRTGAVMGTPAYMAPEQHMALQADARSDQFSFSVALYEGLYGHRPFRGDSVAALALASTEGEVQPPPSSSRVPSHVQRAVLRGLSPVPEDRFTSMEEMIEALRSVPGVRRWRIAAMAGLGALLLGSGWGLYAHQEQQGSVCEGGRAKAAEIWDSSHHAQVRIAFSRSGIGHAGQSVPRVLAGLDAYADSWSDMYKEACVATHVHGQQSGKMLDLRMACLEQRRGALAELVGVMESADETVVNNAVQTLAELPRIEDCADTEALSSGIRPPEDPAVAEAVEGIRGMLGEAKVLMDAGRYEQAHARASAALQHAQSTEYAPVVAEAMHRLGEVELQRGAFAAASEHHRTALRLALATKHDALAADAASALVYIVGYKLVEFERGQDFATIAEALAERIDDPKIEAIVHRRIGVLADSRGRTSEARAHYEAAHALRLELYGDEHPLVAESLMSMGNAHLSEGDYDGALKWFYESVEMRERLYGPGHPAVASALNNVALALRLRGDVAESRAPQVRNVEIYEATFGENHPGVAHAVDNLGRIERELGNLDAAEANHRRAIEIRERVLGPEHSDIGDSYKGLGFVHLDRGEIEAARQAFVRSLELHEPALGPRHIEVGRSLIELAMVEATLGEHQLARERVDRAADIVTHAEPTPIDVASMYFAEAKVCAAEGCDAARVEQALTRATLALSKERKADRVLLEEIEAWSRERSVRVLIKP